MHTYLVVAGAPAVTLVAAGGIAALTTGWVMPWRRSRVLRPRLWGYGSLICAVGGGLYMFVGPFSGPPAGVRGDVAWCGWVAFMAGLGVQFLAQRPGRTPRATKGAA
ncbi:hypothetical protein [Streptomyces sp. NBC_00847]|uniref:hypothetical protein n=1 Tax=Streptomyces sp. NBC_00847 TaxID=2975850 RepID=UPI00225C2A7A|nr:hypothetical protein [Streptomyces sp. NBC_00847]MCX4883357.1 hypothetical protein [Streptomyces sp. NBC_00847]